MGIHPSMVWKYLKLHPSLKFQKTCFFAKIGILGYGHLKISMPFFEFCEGGASQGRTRRTNGGRVCGREKWQVSVRGDVRPCYLTSTPSCLSLVTSLLLPPLTAAPTAHYFCPLDNLLIHTAPSPPFSLPFLGCQIMGWGWYPHYWDHKIEHRTYGTHGISAYGTYVVVCVPYAPRGSRTTRLPSLRLFRSLPPFCGTPGTSLRYHPFPLPFPASRYLQIGSAGEKPKS